MPRTITCIRLRAYSDRARLSESVVYEYNRRINRLRAWPWYVTINICIVE